MAGPIRISILADDRASRVFGSVGGSVGMLSGRVGKYGKAMGLAVAGGAVVAGAATVKWASDSVTSLARIERINTQTQAAIKSTGGAAGVSAKHIENYAGKLENLTATEAETTQENANLLLTFTNVQNKAGKGNAIFDRTVKTFVDMQRAIPTASMTSLGKALNDPVKGISALSRVGVSFTDQQKKQITSLTEHNRTMEAQKVILGELTKEFGGSGEAFAKTAEGQKALLGHAFGTLGETIFAPLLPLMTKVTGEATVFVNYLNENVGPAFDKVQGYISPVADVLSGFFATAGSGNSALSSSIDGVTGAYGGFYSTVWPIILSLADAIRSEWGSIAPNVEAIFTSVRNTVQSALSIVSSVIKGVTAAVLLIWNKWGDTLTSFTVNSLKNVISALRGAFEIVEGVFQVVASLLKGDWSGVWDGIQKILSGALRLIIASVSQFGNLLSTAATIAWDVLKAIVSKAWDAALGAVQAGIRAEINLVKSLPGRIKGAIGSLGSLLLDAGHALIQGLIDGITDKIGDVEGTLKNLTGKLTSWKGPPAKDKVLLRPAGRMIIAGLIRGFEDGEDGVRKSLEKITDLIREKVNLRDDDREKAREREILQSLKDQGAELLANGKAQDRINAALDTARDRVTQLKDAYASYAASVKDSIVSFGNITQFADDSGQVTYGGIVSGLQDKLTQAKAFAYRLQALADAGLNKKALDQLKSAGVEGAGDTVRALYNALQSGQTLDQVNDLMQQFSAVGGRLGTSLADTMYGGGIKAAEAVVAGLEQRAKRLESIADRMADRFLDRVQKILNKQVAAQTAANLKAKDSTTTKSEKATAERTAADTSGSVTLNLNVTAPVGSSSADIGRELDAHLSAFFTAGGRKLAVGGAA